MPRRSRVLSGTLVATALLLTSIGVGTVAASADPGAAAPAAHAGHTMAASAAASPEDPDGDGYIPANPPVTGVTPSTKEPPRRYFHEFQANCSVTHTAPDDPIVYPRQPGRSHDHTFMGNTTTEAHSTTASLAAGTTTCLAPGDRSAYWMPTMYDGDTPVLPVGPQVIYYKAGVTDYTSVRPFPKGLRYVVGSPLQSARQFRDHPGFVEGWECGDSFSTSTSRPTARTARTSRSTSVSRRPVAGTGATWTRPTTRVTWPTRWSTPAPTTTSARPVTRSPCR
ncbi:hypothetical protein GCM10017779_35800 [Streptomyces capillispiralis]|uniref:Uncharacterized protein DUF1996 n=1 Tax=Streptomyces capillispiralis TaxID=68182 RepID=A0A561TA43_9ACTN|nr:uncharacterized protein DUF1996 [Streptomyces capillispiralis]GHH93123.1 hypothetical protein GCM10017779_35800 [Streptomyces capillispiralis]